MAGLQPQIAAIQAPHTSHPGQPHPRQSPSTTRCAAHAHAPIAQVRRTLPSPSHTLVINQDERRGVVFGLFLLFFCGGNGLALVRVPTITSGIAVPARPDDGQVGGGPAGAVGATRRAAAELRGARRVGAGRTCASCRAAAAPRCCAAPGCGCAVCPTPAACGRRRRGEDAGYSHPRAA